MDFRLVSWNLHGPPLAWRQAERFQAAAEWIRNARPHVDFVLLQEVWFPSKAELLTTALGPEYEAVGVPENGIPGRAGGLLTLVRKAAGWRISERNFLPFRDSAPAWRFWEGDGMADKGVLQVGVERDGHQLQLWNTHLQAQYGPRTYPEVRESQAQELRESLRQLPAGLPVLVAGDFNTTPQEAPYEALAREWEDLTRPLRESCRCSTTVGTEDDSEWIDYLWGRPGTGARFVPAAIERIVSHSVDVPFSDHHGIDARIRLEGALSASAVVQAAAVQALHGPSTRRHWLLAWVGLGLQKILDRVSS